MKSKKLGKITPQTKTRISSPFDIQDHSTERTGVGIIMHWMRNIIEKKDLDLGLPNVETGLSGKFPDAVIYKSRLSKDALCVMEFKPPYFDVFSQEELKEPARGKANQHQAKYFVTSNFRELILWNTEKVNALKKEEEQISEKFHLSEVNDLDSLENSQYKNTIIANLEKFLIELYQFSTGKKAEPKKATDEFLIWRLQEKIHKLTYYYQNVIYDLAHKDIKFAKELKKWFLEQGWSFFIESETDYNKAARQTAYLLANKIIFYNALRIKHPDKLNRLKIPDDITHGGLLKDILQGFFNRVLAIDYKTIYTADFIDQMAFPENKEVVEEIKSLIDVLEEYDFSTLGFDVIGRIFENLIPAEERHQLGQYFTNPDIIDLILKFCLNHEDDKIFDPSCGSGTFLVRAYQHKKTMNQNLPHQKIIDDLWGDDIAKFPAHLATINLAIKDLSVEKNYPNILQEDFFALLSKSDGFELPERWRKARTKRLDKKDEDITYPHWFDAIVGNPPYTRQEEMDEMASGGLKYKHNLIDRALLDLRGKKVAEISKRAGIHAYFFIHGTKFLQDGGYFGFIVSNSWLDVDYGKGLQEFFLKNYKIIAIIESKVERWFKEADINTCIVILQKCKNKKEREENLARFVYLKKPLRHFIPPASEIWENQVERLNAVDRLKKTILAHNEFYENDDLRIYTKNQKELWQEGFDNKEKKYLGTKWGKYLRAPQIFFKILEKGKDKLVPLKEIADVRRGFTTGANEFFYLEDVTNEVEEG